MARPVQVGRLSKDRDVVSVKIGGSRRSAVGFVRSTYSAHEVDLLGVYCAELDQCFLVPIGAIAGKSEVSLRLTPPRNRQEACINLACDFDFAGAIAQLGERVNGIHEVAGSSPASSILDERGAQPTTVGADVLRGRLGYWIDRVAAGELVLVTRRGRPRVRLSPVADPRLG